MKRYLFAVKLFEPAARKQIARNVSITAINHYTAWIGCVNYMRDFLSGNIGFLDEITLVTIEEC